MRRWGARLGNGFQPTGLFLREMKTGRAGRKAGAPFSLTALNHVAQKITLWLAALSRSDHPSYLPARMKIKSQ
jgi:hypothetical protein